MPAAHFPMLAALDRLGPLNVSELAQAVGVSQPVVSRSLLGLQAGGLVDSTAMAGDRRVRSVRLSRKGLALVRRAKQTTWPAIEAAVSQACQPLAGSLLDQLSALEAALMQSPLQERAAAASLALRLPARKRSTA
jgi:DNA-binding MarR family transcriptional regulator